MTIQEKLKQVTERLARLQILHEKNSAEIKLLQRQIRALQNELSGSQSTSKTLRIKENVPLEEYHPPEEPTEIFEKEILPKKKTSSKLHTASRQSRLEQYIGGNLINKIGIVILIIGLGLFVKYAIDNGFFPPIVRLVLSFVAGLVLVTIGYFLKTKYKTYSAVLFSGGMTVLYFTAYAGNVFFDPPMLPPTVTFILMVVFTIVTVIAAAIYDLQIIGLLGLVGAYAVPFLLSDSTGDYRLLLSYLAVINTGILVLSIRKLWKGIIYSAFFLSWLIFSFWWLSEYAYPEDNLDGWLFLSLYFLLFYSGFIAYPFFSEKQIPIGYIVLLTINAFIFYGIGMAFLDAANLENLQGLFTIGNGLVHLLFSLWVYRKWADKKLFYVLFGLFITFVTITIPVQFEGDTIPILWLVETIVLFYVARRFSVFQYEFLSYVSLFLAELALVFNWLEHYYSSLIHFNFLWNKHFLTAALMVAGLVVLNILNKKNKINPQENKIPLAFGNAILPVLLIGTLYFSFYNEIYHHFEQSYSYINSGQDGKYDQAIWSFGNLWLINYTFLFLSVLGLLNFKLWQNELSNFIVIVLGGLIISYFLVQGIIDLNALRNDYLTVTEASHNGFIWIRYVCYASSGILLTAIYWSIRQSKEFQIITKYFPLVVYFIILVYLSNELTTIMQLGMGIGMESLAHKVGYSILWGVYSLILIGIGFWKKSSLLRIAAMVLFAATLLKVFLIDLENISTISRMVLFIALGVLMLVISYLYQRYRDVLLGEDQKD